MSWPYFWLTVYWLGAVAWGAGGAAWAARGDWIPSIFSFLIGVFFILAATVQGAFLALNAPDDDEDS